MAYFQWRPYVPVAKRRSQAKKTMEALRKKGVNVQPVEIDGQTIARTFWGKAWCKHLEGFSDFENRLPRGRTYVRNGSVCHLAISQGKIEAKVSGSELYTVTVQIKTLARRKWNEVKQRCSGGIGSLLELLQGRLSDHVMGAVTDRQTGLFPLPGEMSFGCSCPDWARMCKHVAAVLYGVGNRLDHQPELLFRLRGVDHMELIQSDAEVAILAATERGKAKRLADTDLSDVFGIDLDVAASEDVADASATTRGKRAKATKPAKEPARRTVKKTAKRTAAKSGTQVGKKTAEEVGKKTAEEAGKKVAKKVAKKAFDEAIRKAGVKKKAAKRAVVKTMIVKGAGVKKKAAKRAVVKTMIVKGAVVKKKATKRAVVKRAAGTAEPSPSPSVTIKKARSVNKG